MKALLIILSIFIVGRAYSSECLNYIKKKAIYEAQLGVLEYIKRELKTKKCLFRVIEKPSEDEKKIGTSCLEEGVQFEKMSKLSLDTEDEQIEKEVKAFNTCKLGILNIPDIEKKSVKDYLFMNKTKSGAKIWGKMKSDKKKREVDAKSFKETQKLLDKAIELNENIIKKLKQNE